MNIFLSSIIEKVEKVIKDEQIIPQLIQIGFQVIEAFNLDSSSQNQQEENQDLNTQALALEQEYIQNKNQIDEQIILKIITQCKSNQTGDIRSYQESFLKKIEDFQSKLENYLQSYNDSKETKLWNKISFYYFKVCYFFNKEYINKYEPNDPSLQDVIQKMKDLNINNINKQIEEIIENIVDQQSIDYEETFDEQPFRFFIKNKKLLQPSQFEKFVLKKIELNFEGLKEENDFLNDFVGCYELWGNMRLIDKYRKSKTLLFNQFLSSFLAKEPKTNLITKYNTINYKFFDKFEIIKIIFYPDFLSKLNQNNQDEIYLYFLFFCLLNLLKLNQIALHKEVKLVQLIKKIMSIDNTKFRLGYKFLLKFMIDQQEKLIISESNDQYIQKELVETYFKDELDQRSVISLFKDWTKQKYEVSEEYINRQQLQLYIDSAQSALILAILPDLARFYDLSEPLPYQQTDLNLGFVQQIVRGKRLYLKNPHNKEKNLIYWQKLVDNIKNNITKEKEIKNKGPNNDSEIFHEIFSLCICQINFYTLKIEYKGDSQQKEEEQSSTLFEENLKEAIHNLQQQIDGSLYQNLYRRRQFYQTLSYLFIKDDCIMYYLIQHIQKQSQNAAFTHYQSQLFKNLILSYKQELDLRNFIHLNTKRNFSLQSTDKQFENLRSEFFRAHERFNNINITKDINSLTETRELFKKIIDYYGFLNRQQYQVFKTNILMYISFIDLMIELVEPQKEYKQTETLGKISEKSQFEVNKVQYGDKIVVQKLKKQTENEKKNDIITTQKQQMREISILSKLTENDLIIKYVDHQRNGELFEIFLEYFEGENLQNHLNSKQKEKAPEGKKQKLLICKQILQGIDYLHENNIVHGDIKFTNVLIDSNKKIKIIDFSESGFMVEETIGFTKGYDANDKFKTKYIDYFSLGVMMIKLFYKPSFMLCENCEKQGKYCQHNEKQILEKISKEIEGTDEKIKKNIFFTQIKSLFSDSPYLRCSLKELIYLIDEEIKLIDNNNIQQKYIDDQYKQKYGDIFQYYELSDIVESNVRNALFRKEVFVNQNINENNGYSYEHFSTEQSQVDNRSQGQQLLDNYIMQQYQKYESYHKSDYNSSHYIQVQDNSTSQQSFNSSFSSQNNEQSYQDQSNSTNLKESSNLLINQEDQNNSLNDHLFLTNKTILKGKSKKNQSNQILEAQCENNYQNEENKMQEKLCDQAAKEEEKEINYKGQNQVLNQKHENVYEFKQVKEDCEEEQQSKTPQDENNTIFILNDKMILRGKQQETKQSPILEAQSENNFKDEENKIQEKLCDSAAKEEEKEISYKNQNQVLNQKDENVNQFQQVKEDCQEQQPEQQSKTNLQDEDNNIQSDQEKPKNLELIQNQNSSQIPNQNLQQKTENKTLESYFIDKEQKEQEKQQYPVFVELLNKIDINIRELEIDLEEFVQLNSSAKIFFFYNKLIKPNKLESQMISLLFEQAQNLKKELMEIIINLIIEIGKTIQNNIERCFLQIKQ